METIMKYAGLLLAAAITGCATPPPPGARGPLAVRNPTFATQLAGPETYLAPMPTAVVVLKPDDLNRNRAFCAAVMRLPTAQAAIARSVVAPNLVLTRWLVQMPEVPPDRAADCDFLVGTYDYARAARLIAAVHLSDGTLAGPGPFLLMVIPDATGLHVAGLDGSTVTEAGFPTFVANWGTVLQRAEADVSQTPDEPGVTRSLFNLISAVLRTVLAGTAGLLRGVVAGL
jgi:hypothetical protein